MATKKRGKKKDGLTGKYGWTFQGDLDGDILETLTFSTEDLAIQGAEEFLRDEWGTCAAGGGPEYENIYIIHVLRHFKVKRASVSLEEV